jgi:hypothetical protein
LEAAVRSDSNSPARTRKDKSVIRRERLKAEGFLADGRKGIMKRRELHADNSTATSNIRRENLSLRYRRAFEEQAPPKRLNRREWFWFTGNTKLRLSSIAFGNQTISPPRPRLKSTPDERIGETHGFAPSPRDKFAIIVCNLYLKEQCRTRRV